MKFSPCIAGKCTDQGTHCEGCGRTHEEIAETKIGDKENIQYICRIIPEPLLALVNDRSYNTVMEQAPFHAPNSGRQSLDEWILDNPEASFLMKMEGNKG